MNRHTLKIIIVGTTLLLGLIVLRVIDPFFVETARLKGLDYYQRNEQKLESNDIIIVEIDENQHNSYEDKCECARINEIVNGIGGKSVIIIRYNPDVVKNKNKVLTINQKDRIDLLVKTIKDEIIKEYDTFIVKIVQLYYNDIYKVYKPIKEENITDKVAL